MFSVLPKGTQLYSGRACPHALSLRTYTQHTTWPPRDNNIRLAGYTHRRFLWLGKTMCAPQRGGQTGKKTCSFNGQVSMQPDSASPPVGSFTEAPKPGLEAFSRFPIPLPKPPHQRKPSGYHHYMPIQARD